MSPKGTTCPRDFGTGEEEVISGGGGEGQRRLGGRIYGTGVRGGGSVFSWKTGGSASGGRCDDDMGMVARRLRQPPIYDPFM